MTIKDAKDTVQTLQSQCESLYETAEIAARNKKSLAGRNFYGDKFNHALVELSRTENLLQAVAAFCQLDSDSALKIQQAISVLKSPASTVVQRRKEVHNIRLFCQSLLLPQIENMVANPVPLTEQVLPLPVVHKTRGYLEKLILQANGCYEHQWFDACSVMMRRFTETLIIEVYEAEGRANDIKDGAGEFVMLRGLIDAVLNDRHFNLGRETKRTLPLIKELGDRSAHNRHYIATRTDLDKVIPGFRVAADELLHLANLK